MPTTLRRRLGGDDGISLVEMLVAFVILGIVMTGSASFFGTALFSLHQAESRTKATALANEELEHLRALPWDAVGFYDDDFDSAPPEDTVLLDAERPAAARAPLPTEVRSQAGVTFTIRRAITWNEEITETERDEEYKHLAVSVDWSDQGRARSITVESMRNPTPDEQPTSEFVLSLLEVQPELVYLDAQGRLDPDRNDQLDLRALTSARADFVVARYVERDGDTETVEALGSPEDRLNWTGAVTALQDRRFPNGDALFTFVATRANPYDQEVLGTTLVRFLQPLMVVAVTPSVCLTDPDDPIELTIDFDGLVEEDVVTVGWAGGSVEAQQVDATTGGSRLRAVLPGGSLAPGDHVISVDGHRRSDDATLTATGPVSVELGVAC